MSDDFEDLLKRWLRDRAGHDRSTLQALAGNVAALPPRRRRLTPGLPLAASIVVVLGLILVVLPRSGGVGNEASATPFERSQGAVLPLGPEAFEGDPRLSQCFGAPDDMEFVFEMTHARDYRLYLPAALRAPELEVDDPAFVVVYRDGWDGPPISGVPGAKRPTPTPGRRLVCVLVQGGDPNLYSDVDISGLTINVMPSERSPVASVASTPTGSPSTTPEPAPAWVGDLVGQLECDGAAASIGGEYPEILGGLDALTDTPDEALALFLGPTNPFASLPTAGFTQLHSEPHWASFGHVFGGRAKAIVLLTDGTEFGPGWSVVGLRACDASEFDPAVPLTFPVTIWTGASGGRVSTETIRSAPGPGHCGWESAIWLKVDGALYFRDPQGVMVNWTETRFEPDARLPGTAVDSWYRSGDWSLWLDPGRDAYLVLPDRVERWPRSSDPLIACM